MSIETKFCLIAGCGSSGAAWIEKQNHSFSNQVFVGLDLDQSAIAGSNSVCGEATNLPFSSDTFNQVIWISY